MTTIIEEKKPNGVPNQITKQKENISIPKEKLNIPQPEKKENKEIPQKKDLVTNKEKKETDNNKLNSTEKSEINDEKKENNEIQQNIYYPYLFKQNEEIKQYICPICKMIFDEPVMELCGCCQIYCKRCIKEYLKNNNNKCPSSSKYIMQEPQNVPVIQFTINILDMICKNHSCGCNWKGKCVEYKHHIMKFCPKEKIKCSNKGCKELIIREKMDDHLKECAYRYVLCLLCNSKVQFYDKQRHEDICNNTEVDCPQKCGEKIKKKYLDEHYKICKMKLIQCNFFPFGCKEQFYLKDNESHNNKNINNHLELIANKMLSFEDSIKKLFKLLNEKKTNSPDNTPKFGERHKSERNSKDTSSKNSSSKASNSNNTNKSENEEKNNELNNHEFKNNGIELNEASQTKPNDNLEPKPKSSSKSKKDKEKENNEINNSEKEKEKENTLLGLKRHSPTKEINESKEREIKESNLETEYFDIKSLDKDKFIIKNNVITSKNMDNHQHKYIFASEKYEVKKDSQKVYKYKIKFNDDILWLAFGICDKKKVEENNFIFTPTKKDGEERNNGSYILSVNSMIWNANNRIECKKLKNVDKKKLGKKGAIVQFCFDPNKNTIDYFFEDNKIASLTSVVLFKSDVYTPCIIFLQNCSVEMEFDYPL